MWTEWAGLKDEWELDRPNVEASKSQVAVFIDSMYIVLSK